jgi:hypothetical protein
LDDQSLRQVRVYSPVARFVGVGQRRTPDRFAETHVIEFRSLHRQTGLDIAQTFPIGQLSKSHGSILLGAGECSHAMVAAIA